MSVDPFTFAAQVANFAILVWILSKVLYGPILRAIEAREEAFAERRGELETFERACLALREELESEVEEFRTNIDANYEKASEEVNLKRDEELRKVRLEIERSEQKWLDSLAEKRQAFLKEIRHKTSRAGLQVAQRILRDVASLESIQEAALEVFLGRIGDLELTGPTLVRSSTALSEDEKRRVQRGLDDVVFEVDPDLILGLEVVNNGTRYGFSAQAHLDAFESDLNAVLSGSASL
jgi:F-type H+-transporting ATPase subunit b